MKERLEVWCTGRSRHGRLSLGIVERSEASLAPRVLKSAPAPWGRREATIVHEDGVDPAPESITKMALVIREDFEGRSRWVLTCPKCVPTGRQGRLMRGEKFEVLFSNLIELGQPGFDVSLLPR